MFSVKKNSRGRTPLNWIPYGYLIGLSRPTGLAYWISFFNASHHNHIIRPLLSPWWYVAFWQCEVVQRHKTSRSHKSKSCFPLGQRSRSSSLLGNWKTCSLLLTLLFVKVNFLLSGASFTRWSGISAEGKTFSTVRWNMELPFSGNLVGSTPYSIAWLI